MIKFLEKIYEFTNDGKTYGAYVIEYDDIKHVVIQHENKFYAVAHFVNAPIDKCMMLATSAVVDAIKDGCKKEINKATQKQIDYVHIIERKTNTQYVGDYDRKSVGEFITDFQMQNENDGGVGIYDEEEINSIYDDLF